MEHKAKERGHGFGTIFVLLIVFAMGLGTGYLLHPRQVGEQPSQSPVEIWAMMKCFDNEMEETKCPNASITLTQEDIKIKSKIICEKD